jgi:hypothetical protein
MNVFAPIAVCGFWILLGAGWFLGELHLRSIAIFVVLWVAGLFLLRLVNGALFLPFVALLDIVLVLVVFKGDVRLR